MLCRSHALILLAVLAAGACGRSEVFPRRLPDGGVIPEPDGGGGGGFGGGGFGGGIAGGPGGSGPGGGPGGGSGGSCEPANCSDGCCQNGQCLRFTAQSLASCGLFGHECKSCPAGGRCELGFCRSLNCFSTCSGCCNTDICSPGTLNGMCGSNGGGCSSCPLGSTCTDKKCVPTMARIGDACTSDTQCAGIGAGAYCKLRTSSGNAQYPGGFCTIPCYGSPSCSGPGGPNGGGTYCLQVASVYGEKDVFCSPACGPGGVSCRPGYGCNQKSGQWDVCWLSPLPPADAGVGVGSPCSTNSECASNPGGFCILDMSPTFGVTGYVGGYCTASCTASCPDGACVTEVFPSPVGPLTATTCKARCTGTGLSTCRIGYTCKPIGAGPGGWCGPNCINGGVPCPTGKFCNPMTGECM